MLEKYKIIVISLALVLFSLSAFAHSGRTNADGCHKDPQTGEYHCH